MNTIIIYALFEICSVFFFIKAEKHRKDEKSVIGKIKISTIFLILSFIPLLVLVGFRDISVGVDTDNYALAFDRIINNDMTSADRNWLGFGYIAIGKIIGAVFGDNYIYLNLTIGFLTLFFFYKAIWKNSDIPTLSLYIFISMCLFYQTFNQSRQMLAIAILFYSIQYIKTKNLKGFIFFVLLATSIHSSAIIFLPFYYLCRLNINKKNICFYAMISIFGYLFFDTILVLINGTNYGQIYQKTNYYKASSSSSLNLIIRMGMLVATMFFCKTTIHENQNNKIFYNLIIWCTIMQLLTTKMYILGRITTYFFTSYIILIPNIVNSIAKDNKNKTNYIAILIVLFALYHFVYFKSTAMNSGYDVYKFFS